MLENLEGGLHTISDRIKIKNQNKNTISDRNKIKNQNKKHQYKITIRKFDFFLFSCYNNLIGMNKTL